jgi:hypothetical protein
VRAKLVLEPDGPAVLDFGEVVLGRTRAEPIVIIVSNKGDDPLDLSVVEIQNDPAKVFRVSSYPERLPPSGSNEIWIRYEPTLQASYEATLYIQSTDPDRRNVSYTLKGSAREPCSIEVSPAHARFLLGQVLPLTISAKGGTDCVISYLFTDENMFPFLNPPELPFVIPTGTSIELQIQHTAPAVAPGIPIRDVMVKESEGQEVMVSVEGEPPLFGCLEQLEERITFDETPIGMTGLRTAGVRNRCTRSAYVTSTIVTAGVYYFDVEEDLFPIEVPASSVIDVPVIYTPFSSVGDTGTMIINTNDAGSPRFSVTLFGKAAVPDAVVFPAVLDFGTVVYKNPQEDMSSECTSGAQTVQIYNVGAHDLVVSRLSLDGDAQFEIVGVLVNGTPVADFTQPFSIGPSQDAKVTLNFAPTRETPADHRGRLLIAHNGRVSPSIVDLQGSAIGVGRATDTFEQLAGPKADILWVIDDSCSMFDEQARLIGNLSQFVAYADALNSDYQMAVTDTDGTSMNSGQFEHCFPHPRIVSSSYADEATRQEAFECLFDVGVNGSGVEAGIAAAKNALVLATAADQDPIRNRNAGFVRDNAKLVIVTMSDENDQSPEAQTLLRDYFYSIKPNRRDLVAFHAIAGPILEGCETGPFAAQPGYNYEWMTEQMGGIYYNICLPDWQPLLQSLGIDTFRPLDEFTLSQSADPGTLVVTVDGVAVLPNATAGFSFNASQNTVKFNGASVPAPGAEIIINYEGLCRP